MLKQIEGHVLHRSGHGIHSIDGTNDNTPLIGAPVIPHPYRLQVGNSCEILPHLALQAEFGKLLPEDGIRLPDGLQPVPGDGPQAAHPQAGAGEGLAVDHGVGQAQGLAAGADLVLEEHLQRL